MSLPGQLQLALGSAYRIERELPVHDALRIMTEVADALADAHQDGVLPEHHCPRI